MPDSFSASVIIASVIVLLPASCIRAQTMPGASVEPRPAPAKYAMKRRRVAAFRSDIGAPRSEPSRDTSAFGDEPQNLTGVAVGQHVQSAVGSLVDAADSRVEVGQQPLFAGHAIAFDHESNQRLGDEARHEQI